MGRKPKKVKDIKFESIMTSTLEDGSTVSWVAIFDENNWTRFTKPVKEQMGLVAEDIDHGKDTPMVIPKALDIPKVTIYEPGSCPDNVKEITDGTKDGALIIQFESGEYVISMDTKYYKGVN